MTAKDLVDRYGVSKQTLYTRLSAIGVTGSKRGKQVWFDQSEVFRLDAAHHYLGIGYGLKDLKEAYADSLRKTSDQAIFESIPSHFFWDIKKPLQKAPFVRENRYNPFRGAEYDSFFEARDAEAYMDRMSQKHNKDPSVSLHRRY